MFVVVGDVELSLLDLLIEVCKMDRALPFYHYISPLDRHDPTGSIRVLGRDGDCFSHRLLTR